MNKRDQRRIVNEMCKSQRKKLLELLPNVPENWDGLELRNWFADIAEEGYRFDMGRKRTRDYRNARYTTNL